MTTPQMAGDNEFIIQLLQGATRADGSTQTMSVWWGRHDMFTLTREEAQGFATLNEAQMQKQRLVLRYPHDYGVKVLEIVLRSTGKPFVAAPDKCDRCDYPNDYQNPPNRKDGKWRCWSCRTLHP